MTTVLEVRTFHSFRLPGEGASGLEVLVNSLLPSLRKGVQHQIFFRRTDRSFPRRRAVPVMAYALPEILKQDELEQPDIWVKIRIPRQDVLELRQTELYEDLCEVVCGIFRDKDPSLSILVELELTDSTIKLHEPSPVSS